MEREPVDDPSLWTVDLQKVQRITPFDPEDDVGVHFAVEFEAQGPNLTAQIEVMAVDLADESLVITEALDTAQDGLKQCAAVLSIRPGAGAIKPGTD